MKKQQPDILSSSVRAYSADEIVDYIPFACHYNAETILTKNGQLMQVIKITGFHFDSIEEIEGLEVEHHDEEEDDIRKHKKPIGLRRAIRHAISSSLPSNEFSLWFHTIRKEADISAPGQHKEALAREIDTRWKEGGKLDRQYINEIYISILIEGESASMLDMQAFFRRIIFTREFEHRYKFLDAQFEKINAVTGNIMRILAPFGASRIGMVEEDGMFYSDIIRFLRNITVFDDYQVPVPTADISDIVQPKSLAFSFNNLELITKGQRVEAAIFSIKEHHETDTVYLDTLLQMPAEFIISQVFHHISAKEAREFFGAQSRVQRISGDMAIKEASFMLELEAAGAQGALAYGVQQTTITLHNASSQTLQRDIDMLVERARNIGIALVREDIYLENCYFAQLPGNFPFICRNSPIISQWMGGYASLYDYPTGKRYNNHWGDAVTVFFTASHTPYFFNFHHGDCGHTLIVGPHRSGKTALLNFLLAQSRKFDGRIIVLDRQRESEIFLRALGGKYHRMHREADKTGIRFNPLCLPHTPENEAFLRNWFEYLILSVKGKLTDINRQKIEEAVEFNYKQDEGEALLGEALRECWAYFGEYGLEEEDFDTREEEEDREARHAAKEAEEEDLFLGDIDALLSGDLLERASEQDVSEIQHARQEFIFGDIDLMDENVSTEQRLSIWYGNGAYAHVFDNKEDELNLDENDIIGIDISHMVQDEMPLVPVVYYLLHRIYQSLDGRPTIIVLEDAWDLMDNYAFAPDFTGWLDKFTRKNAILIFATEDITKAKSSDITKTLIESIPTHIFMKNPKMTKAYRDIFGLNDEQFKMLRNMSEADGQFLLLHDMDSIIAQMDLSNMGDVPQLLSATQENLALMDGAIHDEGDDPDIWLPTLRKRMG